MRYNSVSKEVVRLKLHINDICSKTRQKRCAPSTPTQLQKRLTISECSPARRELFDLPSPEVNNASTSVQDTVGSQTVLMFKSSQKMLKRDVKRPMRTLVNNITRGRYNALAKNLIKMPGQSKLVIDVVLKQVEKECRHLTSN